MLTIEEIETRLNPDMLSYEGEGCKYRDSKGNACYVGQFLSDKKAKSLDKYLPSSIQSVWYHVEDDLQIEGLDEENTLYFWEALQSVHDKMVLKSATTETLEEVFSRYKKLRK